MNAFCSGRYKRMSSESLQCLPNVVGPKIVKKDTRLRKAITQNERLRF